jgi:hypothetical protein
MMYDRLLSGGAEVLDDFSPGPGRVWNRILETVRDRIGERLPMTMFLDREDAGRRLATALAGYESKRPVILALPRGGVPVAAEIAAALDAPLDLILVRKVGVPAQPELAMGAVVGGAQPIVIQNEGIIRLAGGSASEYRKRCEVELAEIERRRARYLHGRQPVKLKGRVVIVVDDGNCNGGDGKSRSNGTAQPRSQGTGPGRPGGSGRDDQPTSTRGR